MTKAVTPHSSFDKPGSSKRLCPRCLHWDPRPEDGSGPGMGYCLKRDIVTVVRRECEHYEEATPSKVAARNREIYGQIEEEGHEEEED
jgi:hypothetical protein